MEILRDYFLSVVIALIGAGVIGLIAPENGVGRYVKFAVSLAVLIAVCVPIKPALELLGSFSYKDIGIESALDFDLEKYTQKTNDIINEKSTEIICERIKEELHEKFGIPFHECEIYLETKQDGTAISITRINVILTGYSMWKNSREISDFVSEFSGVECEVILG